MENSKRFSQLDVLNVEPVTRIEQNWAFTEKEWNSMSNETKEEIRKTVKTDCLAELAEIDLPRPTIIIEETKQSTLMEHEVTVNCVIAVYKIK